MAVKHTGDRHRRGYVCPKRQARKMISIYVEPDLAAAVREAAAHDSITVQDKGEKLFQGYVDDYKFRSHNRPPASAPKPNATSRIGGIYEPVPLWDGVDPIHERNDAQQTISTGLPAAQESTIPPPAPEFDDVTGSASYVPLRISNPLSVGNIDDDPPERPVGVKSAPADWPTGSHRLAWVAWSGNKGPWTSLRELLGPRHREDGNNSLSEAE